MISNTEPWIYIPEWEIRIRWLHHPAVRECWDFPIHSQDIKSRWEIYSSKTQSDFIRKYCVVVIFTAVQVPIARI